MENSPKPRRSPLVLALLFAPVIAIAGLVLSLWLSGQVPEGVGQKQKVQGALGEALNFPAKHQITERDLLQAENNCSCVLSVPKRYQSGVSLEAIRHPTTTEAQQLIADLKTLKVCGFIRHQGDTAVPVVRVPSGHCSL